MADRAFKFISPGIFLKEIDNSQIPQLPDAVGPTIIGRATKGPALNVATVRSFSEFIDLYGEPVPGGPAGEYRSSKLSGPTYGVYAAQAYLNANVGPVNYLRVLGMPHPDATGFGLAGWSTTYYDQSSRTIKDYAVDGGGSLGLFLVASGSGATPNSGTLAAVFYLVTGSLYMSGALSRGGVSAEFTGTGSNTMIATTVDSTVVNTQFKMLVKGPGGTPEKTFAFNFDRDSNNYIRKVFNTNPVLTNAGVINSNTLSKNEQYYWLGETYETAVSELVKASNGAQPTIVNAFIAPLATGIASTNSAYHRMRFTNSNTLLANTNTIDAKTGWFISQDISNDTSSYSFDNMVKLFRFHGLDAGAWTHKNIKISVDNIRQSPNPDADPYGTFSIIVRDIRDNDANPVILERFDQVNLNPSSPDYIGARIGDKFRKFDYNQRINKEYGQFSNRSLYVRVELNPAIEQGLDPVFLPFGVYGPLRPKRIEVQADTQAGTTFIASGSWPGVNNTINIINSGSTGALMANFTASIVFPGTQTRVSASDSGMTNPTDAFFGYSSAISAASTRYDHSAVDALRLYGDSTYQNVGLEGLDAAAPFEHQWKFTLDDVVLAGTSNAYYSQGARAAGTSYTATSGGYTAILGLGFDKFTAPFQGGFDLLNIQEAEPFQYNRLAGGTRLNSYEVNTMEVAVDMVANPETVETNILTIPGVRNSSITDRLISVAEARGDSLAIVDLDDGYDAVSESYEDFRTRLGSVTTAVTNLTSRRINSSYACTYYPWVQIRDTINGNVLYVPPSVVALGTMASSERRSEVWFAPAGFNRGGLSAGAAGIPVIAVAEKLTAKQRDTLYLNNINPIASFPSEGIVIFGQKTLQVTPSALDRINVRRMLIYVKKQISRFASAVLFDQNVKVTWNRFRADVEPFLASVQSRLGITEFRMVLDETTTTQDLVDRNVLYAKIFLKPARSIEFIAVDFVITRGGASFED
jgi:hypothetical protein